ncbi:MAG: hypothetical protein ACJAYU_004403 [Bradymonadia bacterium]|jgi:hypothetical protein
MTQARAEFVAAALALTTALLALGTILALPVLPGTDAPTNTMVAWVASQSVLFADYFEVSWAVTAQGFDFLTFILVAAFPLFTAAKVALALYAVMLMASSAIIAKRAGGSPWLALALAAAFSLGWLFAMGFYNFYSGLSLGSLGIALIATPQPSWKRRLAGAAIFLTAAFGHFVAAGLLGLHSLLVRALVTPGGDRRREYALDVLTWTPAGLLSLIPLFGLLGGGSSSPRYEVAESAMPDALPFLLEGAFGGFCGIGWLLPIGLVLAFLVSDRDRRSVPIYAALAVVLVLLIVMPVHVAGWGFAKPRPMFLVAVAWPSLLLFRGDLGRLAPPCLAALCLLVTGTNAVGAAREANRLESWIANYGAVESGRTFEVNFHPEPAGATGPGVRPGIGVPHYATRLGGATPGAFATNPIMHTTLFVGEPATLFPQTPLISMILPAECRQDPACYRGDEFRADIIATMVVPWDTAALVDPPDAVIERLRGRGMTELAPWLWAPSVADLRGDLPAGFRGPIAWQLGYLDTVGIISSGAADIMADGMVLRVTDIPGGPTFLRVHVDPNQDGDYQDGEEVLFQETVLLSAEEPTHVTLAR